MKFKHFLFIGVLFALVACSAPESGYVTKKEYHPAWTQVTQECVMRDPKTLACTMWMPQNHYWPEEFFLCLRNDDNAKDIKTGCRQVPSSEYSKYNVGDYYPDAR